MPHPVQSERANIIMMKIKLWAEIMKSPDTPSLSKNSVIKGWVSLKPGLFSVDC